MATRIYHFTGTGNSLWAARALADKLGDCTLTPMVRALREGDLRPEQERVGLVFPVYMYRMPYLVADFLQQLELRGPLFVVVTCGGDPGDFFVRARRILQDKGLELSVGQAVRMPSNYIPFGGAPDDGKLAEIFAAADERLDEVARIIASGQERVQLEHSRFRALVHPGLLYRLGYKFAPVTDKNFRLDETCNGCGLCARICPVENIELNEERPSWKNQCQQCMACLQFCPVESIQVKEKTRGERRYRHPDLRPKDLVAQKGAREARSGGSPLPPR